MEREGSWLDRIRAGGWLQAAFAPGQAMRDMIAALEGDGPRLAEVRDFFIRPPGGGPIAARYYTPLAAGAPPGAALVYFHGGGFVAGDLDTHDGLCRRLAAGARTRVLSVAYRLAPKHRFPAALEDAFAAFDWAVGEGAESLGIDPTRIGVGGDSAGGNLAAVVTQERRGAEGPSPAFQILLYPLLQLVETNISRLKALEGHMMSHAILEQVRGAYIPDELDPADIRVSPLLATDLAGLAPAHIVTAGLDPLHAEGRAYAERLAAAGVAVTHRHYARAPHGFMQATGVLDTARQAVSEACEALAAALDA